MVDRLLQKLQVKIGVSFRNRKLLLAAITHPSFGAGGVEDVAALDFQRLEFLGDAILNFFIARRLYCLFPQATEGLMSRLRSTLVSRKLLSRVGRSFNLLRFMRFQRHNHPYFEFAHDKIMADSLEALIAAIYLDKGLKSADRFLEQHFTKHLNVKKLFRFDPNPKSTLQEHVQKQFHILPTYHSGPRKKHIFTAWVTIQEKKRTKGQGRTLREAEADAAAKLLKKLKVKHSPGQPISFPSGTVPKKQTRCPPKLS